MHLIKIKKHKNFWPKTPYIGWLNQLRQEISSLFKKQKSQACQDMIYRLDDRLARQLLAIYDPQERGLFRPSLFSDIDLENVHSLAFLAARAKWLETEAVIGQNHTKMNSPLQEHLKNLEIWALELYTEILPQEEKYLQEDV